MGILGTCLRSVLALAHGMMRDLSFRVAHKEAQKCPPDPHIDDHHERHQRIIDWRVEEHRLLFLSKTFGYV